MKEYVLLQATINVCFNLRIRFIRRLRCLLLSLTVLVIYGSIKEIRFVVVTVKLCSRVATAVTFTIKSQMERSRAFTLTQMVSRQTLQISSMQLTLIV